MIFFEKYPVAWAITAAVIVVSVIFGIKMARADMLAVTPGNWVCDGAEVLSEDTENTVRTYNTTFDQSYSAYVAVATVPSLKGWDADAYAEELFNRWSLQGNDFLLMLDIGGNQSYLYNGSNYTNFNFSSYLDTYVNTDFFAGNYDAAVTGLMAGMESYLSQYNGGYSPENGVTPAEDTGNYTDYAQMEQQTNLLSGVIIVLALLAVVYTLLCSMERSRYRSWYSRYGRMDTPPVVFTPIFFWHRPPFRRPRPTSRRRPPTGCRPSPRQRFRRRLWRRRPQRRPWRRRLRRRRPQRWPWRRRLRRRRP